MRSLLLLILSLSLAVSMPAQNVWPGDINNNGTVSAVDLLYWGVAFGAEGPARTEVSASWEAKPILGLWADDFPGGPNYVYADCNGDGVVNEDDFDDAIDDNFGEENPPVAFEQYANAQSGAPKLRLTPSATLVEEGAIVSIALSIDTSEFSLNDFYGLALQLSYSTGLLAGDDGPDFDLTEDSWLEADNSFVQELFMDDDGQGTAQLAITRTNQQSVTAQAGVIGQFEIIVEDIIVGLEVDTFILRIDSVMLVNDQLGITPIIPDTTQIIIVKDTSKLTTSWLDGSLSTSRGTLRIYPNPVADILYVQSPAPFGHVRLVSSTGHVVLEQTGDGDQFNTSLSLVGIPPGVYWLHVWTATSMLNRRVVVSNP